MSVENDIFNNPLEAFPEFIDEPVHESEPAKQKAAPVTAVEKPAEPVKKNSSSYVDPLDTIEEIDISAFSDSASDLSFESGTPAQKAENSPVFEKANLTLGSIEYEDVAVKPGAELYDIDDSVPDAVTETEEVSLDDFLSDAGSGTEEVDLDAFLGDSGFSDAAPAPSAPAGGTETEEISLDDFGVDFGSFDASAVDAFASSSRQEKSDIENAPAIEMELEFDDDFVLETKANPEDDIDFDFEALMSGDGAPAPQAAATGDELLDNFDDIFNNIVDETPAAQASGSDAAEFDPSAIEEVSLDDFGLGSGSSAPAETVSEQQITFDEVSEFDDLLSSFSDDTHVEVADNRKDESVKTGPREYNIIVVMEDDDAQEAPAPAPVVEESTEDEDYEVSLFTTDAEAENYRKHGVSPVPQVSEGSFEMPDIPTEDTPISFGGSSDTFEDVSLDDFGISFHDEEPMAKLENLDEDVSSVPSAEEAPVQNVSETLDETDMPEEPEFTIEDTPVAQDIPENEPETFDDNDFSMEEPVEETAASEAIPDNLVLPEIEDIPLPPDEESEMVESEETFIDEPSETTTECEDTTIDDKKIIELSEECVYNEDNTEYTSDMIDGNNEEISDTMDSMNEGLLEKIVSELSVLRTEMETLRDEVQTLKGGEPVAFDTEAAPAVQEDAFALPDEPEMAAESPVSEEEIPIPEADPFAIPPQEEAGGFFSGDDDDETIALSGDELNNILNSADFTQEDGSNFGMEPPEGSVLPDDFGMDIPAEDAPAEEAPVDEAPAEEAPAEEAFDIPVEEAPAPAEDDFDINFDEPAAEETAEAPAEAADDFDTDLPNLKDETEPVVEEAPAEEAPAEENFSLDEFDIPEPAVEENSIADIDIDEPEDEPKAEEEFSLDEFDIPEPTVEDNAIENIDIDEPSSEIPADEPAAETEDTDFYSNSDSPAISEDDISTIDIQENLEEPVLDDIDFGMDEPAQEEEIEIPTSENLVVDSSSTDFLEEEDPTLDEQLTSDKVDYLNEEASVDDLGALPEVEDVAEAVEEEAPAVEGMEDSLEADTLATSEDETPADDVFSSQWDAVPAAAEEPAFDEAPAEEETVKASMSFDDPVGFDAEPAVEEAPADDFGLDEQAVEEAPADDFGLDEQAVEEAPADDFSLDEPVEEVPADEPEFDVIAAYEAPAPEAPAAAPAEGLDGDIKQEVKSVLKYMDQLLENLPEDKIAEFAQSEHFETYKKLFNELGLV